MTDDFRKSIATVAVKDFHDNAVLKVYSRRINVSTIIYYFNKEGYAVMFPANWREERIIWVRKEL